MSSQVVKPPRPKQLLILRIMIIIGIGCMAFFMYSVLRDSVVGYKPLYWLLISTFVYTSFKILYEWYHYWAISVPATPPKTRQYTVDFFTTFCAGEPYEMIVETLTALQAITYPHETYLCDEADDPYLKEVCQKLGVHHVTRTVKINAKAGNINNALKQSKGELCVVLDPDHIPEPDFLDPIVSHFDNPEIGFVQIVQAYYNQDDSWIAKGAAQQTYQFYGPMMMTMNSYGTVQAIGANCTFRRTALESIGGHAAGLAEDMHTAMQLHAKGWKSVYVPAVLTRGLVPATLSAYYKQQLKWSRGVFELLVTSYVKLFTKFTWRQKLHYGLIPLFYLSGFVFLFNFLIPIISLLGDVYPLKMDFSAFALVGLPFITSIVFIRHYVQQWVMEDNERGFHIVGGFLLIGTWWVFILGFIYTIIRKNVPYIPTPKDIKDEKNLKINLPNICVLLVSVAAIIYGLHNDWNPFTLFMAGIVGINCLFMLFMLMISEELKLQPYIKAYPVLEYSISIIRLFKRRFWLFRRRVYSGIRTAGLMLTVLAVCISVFISSGLSEDADSFGSDYQNDHLLASLVPESSKKPFIDQAEFEQKKGSRLPVIFYNKVKEDSSDTDSAAITKSTELKPNYFLNTRGITYTKGLFWYKNIYPLTKRVILNDFEGMKDAGANTIKIYGPTIYDKSSLSAAHEEGLKVNYSFWVPKPAAFVNNGGILDYLSERVLKTVHQYKTNPDVVNWSIGDDALQELNGYYKGQQLQYAKYKYVVWLKGLIKKIKEADPHRSVTVDVSASLEPKKTIAILHDQIPQIDAFGLIVKDTSDLKIKNLNVPYFFSSADPQAFIKSGYPSGGTFYAKWQDQQTGSMVSFDGLKDVWGRNKPYLSKISESWHGKVPANNLPYLKILRPALTNTPGEWLPFNALVYQYDKWNLAAYMKTGLNFEWYLVKTDNWGNTTSMTPVGNGPEVNIQVPYNPWQYRLYLVASKGNNVSNAYSVLNIPLK